MLISSFQLITLVKLRMRLFKKLKPNLTEEVRILVGGGKVYEINKRTYT